MSGLSGTELMKLFCALISIFCFAAALSFAGESVGVVSHVKVVSDKVPDISSMEAWKKAYIKDGMSDQEKALAVWKTVATFQHQDAGVMEYLHCEDMLTDALKVFNVYGHSFCGMASAHMMSLARYAGLEARGFTVTNHVVCEVKWDGEWHLLDSSLICYFPKPDKKIASIEEVIGGVKDWYAKNPGFYDGKKADGKKITDYHRAGGWQGWKKGPEVLANCPQYDGTGWLPAKSHGWYATMQEYDGSTHFLWEQGFSQGYQVNIQLRKGEKITRNWSHKGLCMENTPGCLNTKVGEGPLAYSAKMFGDLANGRIGNGTLEYNVPLGDDIKRAALQIENLEPKGNALMNPGGGKDGLLIIRNPSPYVYLTGKLDLKSNVQNGGEISVLFSDNNGITWKDVAKITDSKEQTIDLKPLVYRRYDYRIKLVLKGSGTAIDSLKFTHDIQHSQRPLPALDKGDNKLTFSSGSEGTITVEGSTTENGRGKQVMLEDFKPTVNGLNLIGDIIAKQPRADVTFPIESPGDITRVRFGFTGRVGEKKDEWLLQVSFDEGKTFKTVDSMKGPARFASKFATFSDVPAGARKVLVRFAIDKPGTAMIFKPRIDVDYKEPHGGFTPIKTTYVWDENGKEMKDVHVSKQGSDEWTIKCDSKPVMKSITQEWAE
jgi:hypothetical protein